MTFDEFMREAALAADKAVSRTMKNNSSGGISDEPEITAYLVSQLDFGIGGCKPKPAEFLEPNKINLLSSPTTRKSR